MLSYNLFNYFVETGPKLTFNSWDWNLTETLSLVLGRCITFNNPPEQKIGENHGLIFRLRIPKEQCPVDNTLCSNQVQIYLHEQDAFMPYTGLKLFGQPLVLGNYKRQTYADLTVTKMHLRDKPGEPCDELRTIAQWVKCLRETIENKHGCIPPYRYNYGSEKRL